MSEILDTARAVLAGVTPEDREAAGFMAKKASGSDAYARFAATMPSDPAADQSWIDHWNEEGRIATEHAALDALRAEDKARIAALEAALVSFETLVNDAAMKGVEAGSVWHPIVHDLGKRIRARLDEIGQTSALSAALADQKTRVLDDVKARVEGLAMTSADPVIGLAVNRYAVLAAIEAAREG